MGYKPFQQPQDRPNLAAATEFAATEMVSEAELAAAEAAAARQPAARPPAPGSARASAQASAPSPAPSSASTHATGLPSGLLNLTAPRATAVWAPGSVPPRAASADSLPPDSLPAETLPPDSLPADSLPADLGDDIHTAAVPTLSHIGRYALKHPLGQGGLGTVYEAWDPLLSRTVAVKTLQFDIDTPTRVSLDGLFLNEARLAAGLNHPGIVTIFDAGLSAHGVYIAMERLRGRDLRQALAAGWRPDAATAALLVRRVADALAYAHGKGVVHCDVKPGNIYINHRERPKLLDFGIARVAHSTSLPGLEGLVTGSPHYLAPEQLLGQAVDGRTDLYSLGVVLHELLTGRKAFDGGNLQDITSAVLTQGAPPAHEVLAGVPLELSAIAARAMARHPADRYRGAAELSQALRRWLSRQGAATTAASPAEPEFETPRPRPAPIQRRASQGRWVLLVAALVLALALAVFSWARQLGDGPGRGSADNGPGRASAGAVAAATTAATATTATEPTPSPTAAAAATPVAGTDLPAAGTAVSPTPAPALAAPVSAFTPAGAANAQANARAAPRPAASNSPRNTPNTAPTTARDTRLPLASAATPVLQGQVQLAISPWGHVEVNGQAAGTTPPLTRLNLPEGSHTITLRNEDFPVHTVTVQVSADKPATVRHRFGS